MFDYGFHVYIYIHVYNGKYTIKKISELKSKHVLKSVSQLQITASPTDGFHVHNMCSCIWLYVVHAPL